MSELTSKLAVQEQKLLACVHCGLCLEACPTYTLTGDENDSPRGRIYLMRAVEEGKLAADSRAFKLHIDRCLGCRACEPVCPAGVEYGHLLEASRAELFAPEIKRTLTFKLLRLALAHVWLHPARLRFAFAVARFMRDSRITRLFLKSRMAGLVSRRLEFAMALLGSSRSPTNFSLSSPRSLSRLEETGVVTTNFSLSDSPSLSRLEETGAAPTNLSLSDSPSLSGPEETGAVATNLSLKDSRSLPGQEESGAAATNLSLSDSRSLSGPEQSGVVTTNLSLSDTAVSLFLGCVGEGLFARVNRATARVLEANGFRINTPQNQVCCGALHAHAGDLEGARVLARRNIEAFSEFAGAPIITNAGGCGAMLAGYDHLLAGDEPFRERARKFSARIRDVSQQLEGVEIKQGAELDAGTVTYDASCHLINAQQAGAAPLKLLQAIPHLRFVPLEGAERCCGAAGVYNLLEPNMSRGVLKEKLAKIRASGAATLTTGNAGCQMQIGAGAKLDGLSLRVCHPVELLDESYARGGFYS